MGSWIDARTRDNPEAAMLNSRGVPCPTNEFGQISDYGQQAIGDPWPWPKDPVLNNTREERASGGQMPAPHPDAIDWDAYEAFMRSLG